MVSASFMMGTVLAVGSVQSIAIITLSSIVAAPVALGTLAIGASVIVGGAMIGADEYSFDCWKQIVHNNEETKSKGVTYDYLINHKNVKEYFDDRIVNVWNEEFKLNPVLFNNEVCYHATGM
jgi:predicted transposase YbfD/YdcC